MMRTAFGFPRTGDRGFTLAEVMVATFVLSIGLVAVATGFQYATSGVEIGKGETQAVFLAEQRVEQLKSLALTNWAGTACSAPYPSGCLTAATTSEGYGTITGSPLYRRSTTITDNPGAANAPCSTNCKLVTVTVFYKPVTARGEVNQERSVVLVVLLASRT
jgi:prepilin-type N-terminal cleavage/methylation domain-containing protein